MLKTLRAGLEEKRDLLLGALKRDLGKPPREAFLSEIGVVLNEIDYALSRLRSWTRPRRARTPLIWLPASSRVVPEPKGVALIIGPWNYPIGLLLTPLVGALAAGCPAILKPSEDAPASGQALESFIGKLFPPEIVAVVRGGAQAAEILLQEEFGHVFFTGSQRIGKKVMAAAALTLTPVTLELGGKNPCIVDESAVLGPSARRIAWGKFFNAGQTCVAPDYLLVPSRLKAELIDNLKAAIDSFYGNDPRRSPDYARIVNERHFQRLLGLLKKGKVAAGGESDAASLYLAPTLLEEVGWGDPVMAEEIFGPILPILEYEDLETAIEAVNSRPRPLALYFFSGNRRNRERILAGIPSGGACLNDTLLHILSPRMPFGGIGASGVGGYHGQASFATFTHFRSVMVRSFRPETGLRYPPYPGKLSGLGIIRRLLR